MRHRERGAALLETAIALPVMLIVLYGVTWGVRVGTVFERAESAVRYAGVLSAQQSPYYDYSLFALYNNLGATAIVRPQPCQTPSSLLLTGGSMPTVPGTPAQNTVEPLFWQPDPGSFRSNCQTQSGREQVSGADLSRSYLLLMSGPTVSASVSDSLAAGPFALTPAKISTSTRFYRSPDLATLMHCENLLSNPVSVSLQPKTDGRVPAPSQPLTDGDLALAPIAASANCAAAPGAQATLPPSPPYSPTPGAIPPPSRSTPPPTATPEATPTPVSTPTPRVTPTSGATPTPGASATPVSGGGGGGGGGGATPTVAPKTPAPTAAPTAAPKTPAPTAAPTAAPKTPTPTAAPKTPTPTAAPKTPAPTKAPSTPQPIVTPVPTAVPKPSPSPTSNGTIS